MPYDMKTGINSETGLTRAQEEALVSPKARKERRKTESRVSEIKNLQTKEKLKSEQKKQEKRKALKNNIKRLRKLLHDL